MKIEQSIKYKTLEVHNKKEQEMREGGVISTSCTQGYSISGKQNNQYYKYKNGRYTINRPVGT